MNLAHFWLLSSTPPDKHEQINRMLTGPPTSSTPTVDAESGLIPPPWWESDEEASRSSFAASSIP